MTWTERWIDIPDEATTASESSPSNSDVLPAATNTRKMATQITPYRIAVFTCSYYWGTRSRVNGSYHSNQWSFCRSTVLGYGKGSIMVRSLS